MFKVNYDTNTGEILGYYPLGVDYPNGVPEPTIEITGEQRQSAYNKIVTVVDGKFVVEDQPEQSQGEIKQSWLNKLNVWLKIEMDELQCSYTTAQIRKDTVLQTELRSELEELELEYQQMKQQIEEGINPWEGEP